MQKKRGSKFDNKKIDFEVSLIPSYKVNANWIEEKIVEMKEILNRKEIPEINIECRENVLIFKKEEVVFLNYENTFNSNNCRFTYFLYF